MYRSSLFQLVLAASWLVAAGQCCVAANAPTTAAVPAATTATTTPIADPTVPITKLAGLFGKARGLSFSSKLTYTKFSFSDAPPSVRHLDVLGEFNKPGQFVYHTAGSGSVICDGQWAIAEDSTATHYSRYASTPGFALGADWDYVSTHVLKGESAVLNYSTVGYLFGHIGDRDFLHPQYMAISGANTTINNKPVQDIEYKDAAVDVHLLIDPATGLLTAIDTTYFVNDMKSAQCREDITKLTLSPTALPATDYVTTPPPSATMVVIPPPTKPKATPAPKPAAQPKQWRFERGRWVYR